MQTRLDVALATPDQMRRSLRRAARGRGLRADATRVQQVRDWIGPPGATGYRRDLLIEYLHRVNDAAGALHRSDLAALSQVINVSQAEIYETASFYHHFHIIDDDAAAPTLTVRVCSGLSCQLAGPADIDALARRLGDSVRVVHAPCMGLCDTAPAALVGAAPVPHATAQAIVEHATGVRASPPPPFVDYASYLAAGGYEVPIALHAGRLSAPEVVGLLENANLRGLGGAGFPAGRKWRIVREQPAPRLMAVNIDEGEPGTFKDRYYLERDPHRFLEGMLVAALAVGVEAIYIYLRDEYADARRLLCEELDKLQAQPPFPLPSIELRRGAGAYICGEESAMLESIEGRRGEPRMRPPYIAQVGLFGRPTLEHNFETLYWVRDIVRNGAEWFTQHGRRGRRGLRSFSVSGRVRRPGVHLAPAGISVRELIDEYCGGMAEGHELHAYLPGGASGGILPASLADLPLDFDTLQAYGCFIGSAAIVVLGHRDRARDAALNAMQFFADESCGQCTPCRVGNAKAARLMTAPAWDEATLGDIADTMADASICGLGQAAPNPLRSIFKHFRHEIE